MAASRHVVYAGVGGHVVAVDASTGAELWRAKLKGSSYVTLSHSRRRIYAGAGGELFCLDSASGRILWRNKLKGLGLGIVAFGSDSELVAAAAEQAEASSDGGAAAMA